MQLFWGVRIRIGSRAALAGFSTARYEAPTVVPGLPSSPRLWISCKPGHSWSWALFAGGLNLRRPGARRSHDHGRLRHLHENADLGLVRMPRPRRRPAIRGRAVDLAVAASGMCLTRSDHKHCADGFVGQKLRAEERKLVAWPAEPGNGSWERRRHGTRLGGIHAGRESQGIAGQPQA